MLDDPLSAVDAHVSKYLFNSCICEKLSSKTRILVTHQLQYVSSCDQVLYVENGTITESGTYQQLMSDKKNFFKLMSTYVGEEEEQVDAEDVEGVEREESKSDDEVPGLPRVTSQAEKKRANTKAKDAKAAKKGLKSAKKSSAGQLVVKQDKLTSAEEKMKAAAEKEIAKTLMQAEERTKGGVPLDIYLYYLKHCGGWFAVAIALGIMCLQTATSSWTTWWLNLWSDNEYNKSTNWSAEGGRERHNCIA